MRRPGAILLGMLITLMLLPGDALAGKRLRASSEQLQALFIQRLVNYVSWPQNDAPKHGEAFIIAATNAKKLRPYFKRNDGAVRFKLVQWPASEYHVLVLNGAPPRESAAILQRTAGRSVLTIGQRPVDLHMGVIVNFYRAGGNIKLQVNPKAARKAGLHISSKLMRIARIYTGDEDDR